MSFLFGCWLGFFIGMIIISLLLDHSKQNEQTERTAIQTLLQLRLAQERIDELELRCGRQHKRILELSKRRQGPVVIDEPVDEIRVYLN